MNDIVVDSSVVAKWVLPESDSLQAQKIYSETTAAGGHLIVVDLALSEVANSIWKRLHRRIITVNEARAFMDMLLRMPVNLQPAAALLLDALDISARYDRSIYDALFVALARKLGVKAVTADEALYNSVHPDFPQIILLRNW